MVKKPTPEQETHRKAYLKKYRPKWEAAKRRDNPEWVEERKAYQRKMKKAELKDPVAGDHRRAVQAAWHKKRWAEDPEYRETKRRQAREKYQRTKIKDPESLRVKPKLWKYGLTLEAYQGMIESQNKLCAICNQPETKERGGKVLALSIDHCHTKSKVRGLLCDNCNHAIGLFKDNPKLMRIAALYIEKHNQL